MMREVWWDIGWMCFGLVLIGLWIAEDQPGWALALLGFVSGGQAVFALADYRDVIRRRAGILGADIGWQRAKP
jgi:hypothetical protein